MTAFQDALALLWRSWKAGYGGEDAQYVNDLDSFLEYWPVETLNNQRVADYVLDVGEHPRFSRMTSTGIIDNEWGLWE